MDDINAELFGFDFRGPSSSEALNQFLENTSTSLGTLLQSSYQMKNETNLLGEQTTKQMLAMSMKLNENSSRDTGSNCKADLTDSDALQYFDRNMDTILTKDRLVHRQQFPCITPPVDRLNWLSRDGSERNYVVDGVADSIESLSETGTLYPIPLNLAYAGLHSLAYERILVSNSVVGSPQTTSLFFGIPVTRTGTGYPSSNYISYLPFPIYTPSMRVWYTTDSEPILTRAGANWYGWTNTYTDLYHNSGSTWFTHCGPLFSSFPANDITAIRIDVQQSHYLVEGNNYVYSYGLGGLEFGLIKSTSTTPKATVKITKPTGNFVSINSDAANVVFTNIPSAEADSVVSTYSWIDPEDATTAYVELTLSPSAASAGQIPVIKEVSVDYT